MSDLKMDDFSGKTFNPEDEQVYTIEVKKKVATPEGKTQTLRILLEVTHDSFMQIIGKPFEGKKILERWSHWENPTDEVLAKYPKARGHWVREKK